MDFFARQEKSRQRTRLLLLAFAAAVLGTTLAVTIGVALVLRYTLASDALVLGGGASWQTLLADNWPQLLGVAVLTLAVIVAASLYRHATLARGGAQVARMLGGSEVLAASSDPLHRRLHNVVEEIALASGAPVPAVFVLEQEPAINAFAAGSTLSDAAIAVTRGALERLDRAELQGVVAHEFSHIVNGDMRLNQRLMAYAFGILVISLAGRWLLRSRQSWRSRRHSAAVAIGAVLSLIGAVGLFSSRLIKAAVSRQRELLADAAAVQYTREPLGLAGALKKISAHTGRLSSVDSEEISHMLFSQGTLWGGLFATHPPLLMRIRLLDPAFDPERPVQAIVAGTNSIPAEEAHAVAALAAFVPPPTTLDPLALAGSIDTAEVGRELRAAIPQTLHDAATQRESSLLLLLALAIAPTTEQQAPQWQLLNQQLGAARSAHCRRLYEALAVLDRRLHLPLLEIALPALRERSVDQLQFIRGLLERVARVGGEPRLFDHLLLRLLDAYVTDLPQLADCRSAVKEPTPVQAMQSLLAAVAAHGHDSPRAAHAAYLAGRARLRTAMPALARNDFEPLSRWRDIALLDRALERLRMLPSRARGDVLAATWATIRHDNVTGIEEFELFRVISAMLDAPLPPVASTSAVL